MFILALHTVRPGKNHCLTIALYQAGTAVILGSLLLLALSVSAEAGSPPVYSRDAGPILAKNCFSCHGVDEKSRKADLRLDAAPYSTAELQSGTQAIVPGNPGRSEMIARIFSDDESEVMPPADSGKRLTRQEKQILRDWIAAGAKYESHWSLTAPVRHDLPAVRNSEWTRNEIDRFILRAMEERGLTPAVEADRRTLARRLYLDLIGLPPTPEEMQAFVKDASRSAYESLVDRLLASPRYGERWARFWLDLARYADTAGYEGDPEYPHAWRYRDYVIDAFNNDKPYDKFVKEQIAGDELEQIRGAGELPAPMPEDTVATTFLRLAPFTEPRGDETRDLMLSEMTGTVGSVFLAQTVACAKCHDHKYDQIPTKDFYRLKAFLPPYKFRLRSAATHFRLVARCLQNSIDLAKENGPIPEETSSMRIWLFTRRCLTSWSCSCGPRFRKPANTRAKPIRPHSWPPWRIRPIPRFRQAIEWNGRKPKHASYRFNCS